MKILFISMENLSTNSSATIQNKGIIASLYKAGHNIDTLTLEREIKSLSFDDSMNDVKEYIEQSYYIPISKKYKAFMSKKQTINTPKNSLLSLIKSFKKILRHFYNLTQVFDAQKINIVNLKYVDIDYDKYDLVFSCSDPKSSHLIANKILKKKRILWIQYWGDPMFYDITRRKSIFDLFVKASENYLIKRANLVFYASPLTLTIQKKTYISYHKKMKFINQVALDYIDIPNISNVFNSLKLKIVYSGSYNTRIRNILPLYNSFANSTNTLKIVGNSNIKLEATSNVQIIGVVDFIQAQSIERDADILITICNKKGSQIPGKIYYYAQYNKPIIVILDGEFKSEIKTFLTEFNRYIFCLNNENSIIEAIDSAKKLLLAKADYKNVPYRLSTKYMGIELTREIIKVKEEIS